MTATPEAASAPAGEPRPPLRLVVAPPPQPPLQDERLPVRLVLPGVAVPRPSHRPGPRPRTAVGHLRGDVDFGPTCAERAVRRRGLHVPARDRALRPGHEGIAVARRAAGHLGGFARWP